MIPVAAMTLVVLAVLVLQHLRDQRRDGFVSGLLERQADERLTWARERWELNTRIQAPEAVRMVPPAPPVSAGTAEPDAVADEPDEYDMVGKAVTRRVVA